MAGTSHPASANVTVEILANWRSARAGPPSFRLGRSYLYPWQELLRLLLERVAEMGREGAVSSTVLNG
jgi:hypothetical protein